ncbi:MAG: HNH endonuclease signature motif containing protein [Variovorax sp.]
MTAASRLPSWRTDKRKTAERGYGGAWQRARLAYLKAHPLCVMCTAEGKVALANVVDHKIPHRGDQALFWDVSNWAALCSAHHNSDKQMAEKSGRTRTTFDTDGRVVW